MPQVFFTAQLYWSSRLIVALGLSWHLDKRIPLVPAIGCVAVVFFGTLTLVTEDEFFIKIKPTVISALFAIGLGIGQLLVSQPT